MQKFEDGDIYLVKFHPGYGSELQKYRPAVIVSDRINAIDSRFVLIAPFTTNTKIFNKKNEVVVKNNIALEKDSVLLCWYLWTIDATRLVKKLGKLSEVERNLALKMVQSLF